MRFDILSSLGTLGCLFLSAVCLRPGFVRADDPVVETGAQSCTPATLPEVQPPTLAADVAAATTCESGTLAGGNCRVGSFRIDRSCANAGEGLSQLLAAAHDIPGDGGVGCIRRMNGPSADAMAGVLASGVTDLCCGMCEGRASTAVGMACASSFGADAGGNRSIVVSGNVFDPRNACADRSDQPVHMTVLHELMHHAGHCGVQGHTSRMFADPESGRRDMGESDFIGESIYGCQYSCYGRPALRDSTNCLACASAVPDSRGIRTPADDAGSTPAALASRLHEFENALAGLPAPGITVPQACRDLWARDTDHGHARQRAIEALRTVDSLRTGFGTCVRGPMHRSLPQTESIASFLSACGPQAHTISAACREIFAAAGCEPFAGETRLLVHRQQAREICDSLLSPFYSAMLPILSLRRTDPAMRAQFSEIRCSDYFPPTPSCPGGGPARTMVQCQAAMPEGMIAQ